MNAVTIKSLGKGARPAANGPLASVAVASLCAALLLSNGRAMAFCRLSTQNPQTNGRCGTTTCATGGSPLRWEQPCLSYTIGSRKAAEPSANAIEQAVDSSFATWRNVTCGGDRVPIELAGTVQSGKCPVPSYSKVAGNANTIVFVEDIDEFNQHWSEEAELIGDDSAPPELGLEVFGLTIVFHDPKTGTILGADMIINQTLFALGTCGAKRCPMNTFDLQNVVTHEAGHFLGLGHSNQPQSTMSACATVGETKKRDLADDDREGLCAIYAGRTAVQCQVQDFLPAHGFSGECASVEATRRSGRSSDGCSALPNDGHGIIPGWVALCILMSFAARRFRRAAAGCERCRKFGSIPLHG